MFDKLNNKLIAKIGRSMGVVDQFSDKLAKTQECKQVIQKDEADQWFKTII